MILLRADNNGEGGTLALMALAQRAVGTRGTTIVLLGIISGALFYGDAVITPALSVLSALEGMKDVTLHFEPYIVPLTVIILVGLFAVQSRGTARVAAFFGPIMCVWFAVIAIAAIHPIIQQPQVLFALNPLYAVSFMIHHGIIGFVTLGAVFLAVTGAEALYADLGHFGKRPIQTAWLFIVVPSLALNYLGQGALVLGDPGAIVSPFFQLFPQGFFRGCMVVLATAATVIASQAVITGAYSLTRQAIQLGLLPRFEIRHTSEAHSGQIFIPRINQLLLVAVVLLVLLFRSSSALASAYGISVTGTMVVTAMMGFVVIWKVWRWSPFTAAAPDRAVLVSRPHLPGRQSAQGVRGRLGAAGARRAHDHPDVHVAARQPAAVREVAQARIPARRPGGHAGEAAAAARARDRRVPDQRSPERADRADA
ncbi:K+ transporter [Bradyrhizobium sp. GM5.1]